MDSWVGKILCRRDRLPIPAFLSFPYGSAGKESARNVRDLGSIPGLGRSPGEGKGYPLQNSGLENSMGCIVHGVAKRRTRLSDFHFHLELIQRHKVANLKGTMNQKTTYFLTYFVPHEVTYSKYSIKV